MGGGEVPGLLMVNWVGSVAVGQKEKEGVVKWRRLVVADTSAHTGEAKGSAMSASVHASASIAQLARNGANKAGSRDSSLGQGVADGRDDLAVLQEAVGLGQEVSKATAAHTPVMASASGHEHVMHKPTSRHECSVRSI